MHPQDRDMSSTAFLDEARAWATRLEKKEVERSGARREDARKAVARRANLAPGTLENLARGRLKTVGADWYCRLRSLVIDELQAELRAHEHEIHVLLATGEDPRTGALAEAQAGIEAIRKALEGSAR